MESPMNSLDSESPSSLGSTLGASPTFVKGNSSLRQLYRKLRLAGAIIFKSYTMR
jgi:hypothetical protein